MHRPNISATLADTVREMIVDGRLPAGSRVNEVHLAAALEVSRTPLREALMRLTAEGALVVMPRLGFHVAPLTTEEFEQIYPMRALLDPEALRLAGKPSPPQLARLVAINEKIRRATKPALVLELDDQFHLELLAGCPNRVLVSLIEQFILRTRRYELALMRERENVQTTAKEHDKVIAKLRGGDMRGACAALRENMKSGVEPILDWLREREEEA
jgi:DNA-binding GntR family transcriptional regulator